MLDNTIHKEANAFMIDRLYFYTHLVTEQRKETIQTKICATSFYTFFAF